MRITAIYVRQSVDRADSISIEQQIEFCSYEARGEPFRVYTDRGYSGKNTNRPQFIQMMEDIRSGSVGAVIVYKLDRISRSILDFSNMMSLFCENDVKFISATEKFDTSSPIGNAMLNICAVFSQLERETIQKRVADAYFSRSSRGFCMGGPVPYGFVKMPHMIGGVHTSLYEPDEAEAENVKLIYAMYARFDTSYGDIVRKFEELGIKKRGKKWERSRIREILLNPIYVKADRTVYDYYYGKGAVIENKREDFTGVNGCYCYKNRGEARKNQYFPSSCRIVLASGEGIVEAPLWLECREKCLGQREKGSAVRKAKNSWLCGRIRCGECGRALVVKRGSGGRYFMCSGRLTEGSCRGGGTVLAEEAEMLVYGEIERRLAAFGVVSGKTKAIWEQAEHDEKRELADALIETVYASEDSFVIKWKI